jgi:hypothetical protein
LELGLLRASFIPPHPIRELRELTHARPTLIQERVNEINRVHKLLESANIIPGLVETDILGASGRAILRALIARERDGAVLAEPAIRVRRQKWAWMATALRRRFTAHHAMLLEEWLAHIA